jgi:hypothetical protein
MALSGTRSPIAYSVCTIFIIRLRFFAMAKRPVAGF